MIKVIKQNKKVYLTVVIILVLVSASVVLGNLLAIVALALAAFAIFLFNPSDSYIILFALVSFANIFKLSPESTSLFTFFRAWYI